MYNVETLLEFQIGMGWVKTQPEIWPDPKNFLENPSQPEAIFAWPEQFNQNF